MKKAFILGLMLLTVATYGQGSAKFKFHSVGNGLGSFHFNGDDGHGGGVSFLADVTFASRSHLFSASFLSGAEFAIMGSTNYSFTEVTALYGRQLVNFKWFTIEGFAGAGYFNQVSSEEYIGDGTSVAFPLKAKAKVFFNKSFGMGLDTTYSFNSVNNILAVSLIFHYRFK